jgi:zeaxanthin glucosyltransferase
MARIALLQDAEEGHLLPAVSLARALRASGHEVWIWSLPAAQSQVASCDVPFVPVFADRLPAGTRRLESAMHSAVMGAILRDGALDETIRVLRPDVVVVLSLLWIEALAIRYRYDVPVVLCSGSLWAETRRESFRKALGLLLHLTDGLQELIEQLRARGITLRRLDEIVDVVLRMPELVLVPPEFGSRAPSPDDPLMYFTGACVERRGPPSPFAWDRIDARLPLVFCSLGGQTDVMRDLSRTFFTTVIESGAARPDVQFVLATGERFTLDVSDRFARLDNVYITGWAPQIEILDRARVMITHGGMGTVKDCIVAAVPMLVCPVGRDQFNVADHVVSHGLGLREDVRAVTPAGISSAVDRLLSEPAFADNARRMSGIFRASTLDTAVGVIERTIEHHLAESVPWPKH